MRVTTLLGDLDDSVLETTTTTDDRPTETVVATEYHYQGQLVRRDVHVTLKQGVTIDSAVASLG